MLDEDLAIDFDEDWAEEDAQAPKVRIKGTVYTLPATIPAKLVLFVHRVRTGADSPNRKTDPSEVKEIVGTLLGADGVEEILAKGIGFDRLGDVLKRCMDLYRKRDNEDTQQGEANAPKGAAPETTGSASSSATGDSSSPTGTANTDATSAPISAVA